MDDGVVYCGLYVSGLDDGVGHQRLLLLGCLDIGIYNGGMFHLIGLNDCVCDSFWLNFRLLFRSLTFRIDDIIKFLIIHFLI